MTRKKGEWMWGQLAITNLPFLSITKPHQFYQHSSEIPNFFLEQPVHFGDLNQR